MPEDIFVDGTAKTNIGGDIEYALSVKFPQNQFDSL